MPTQIKPILYLSENLASRQALSILQAADFPCIYDMSPHPTYTSPSLVYENRIIKGIKNIQAAAYRYEQTKDLHRVFNYDEDETPVTKTKKQTNKLNNSKEMAYAFIGYLIGGLWIITVDMFIKLSPMMQAVLLLIIPVGILGWPYYFPYIKKQIQESRQSPRKN